MGTRSLTTFIDQADTNTYVKRNKIVTMYRQYDGNPKNHGLELAEFLASGKMVNGFGSDTEERLFNGMGCLAAQAISHFKGNKVGGIYLYRGGTINVDENYRYEVLSNGEGKNVTLRCYEVHNKAKLLFEGTPHEFIKIFKVVKTPMA